MLEILKEIFMYLFVITGIIAVLIILYAIVVGFIKSIYDNLTKKKRETIAKEQAIKDFKEFCKFIDELEKENKNTKKSKKTTKKTKNQ